jgi:hypothetical protein
MIFPWFPSTSDLFFGEILFLFLSVDQWNGMGNIGLRGVSGATSWCMHFSRLDRSTAGVYSGTLLAFTEHLLNCLNIVVSALSLILDRSTKDADEEKRTLTKRKGADDATTASSPPLFFFSHSLFVLAWSDVQQPFYRNIPDGTRGEKGSTVPATVLSPLFSPRPWILRGHAYSKDSTEYSGWD